MHLHSFEALADFVHVTTTQQKHCANCAGDLDTLLDTQCIWYAVVHGIAVKLCSYRCELMLEYAWRPKAYIPKWRKCVRQWLLWTYARVHGKV